MAYVRCLTRSSGSGQNIVMGQCKLYILMLTMLGPAVFSAAARQGTSSTPQATPSSKPDSSTTKSTEKPALVEATRVSTAEAARKTASDAAKRRNGETSSRGSGAPDVLEFQATDTATQDPFNADAPLKKKPVSKNVHGSAYGALDGGGSGKRTGGSAGTTFKDGKSSIYVETSRQTTSEPH